ncbi:MAG: helix-turn-helix domain-containing protein [Candidatus Scatovivens sp.]
MAKIGKVLKLFRQTKELSVKGLAKTIGCAATYICDVESDRKSVSWNMLKKFSKVYNVPISEIVRLDEELKKNNWSHVQTIIEVAKTYQKYN